MSPDELVVSKIWRHKVRITNSSITYRDQTIKFGNARAVYWYSQRDSLNNIPLRDTYFFGLSDGQTKLRLKMTCPLAIGSNGQRQAFSTLLKLSDELIEPVIAEQMFQQIQNGQTVRSRNLTLSRQGITFHHKVRGNIEISWSQYHQAQYSGGMLRIYGQINNSPPKVVAVLPLRQANVVALPKLLDRCAETWGSNTAPKNQPLVVQ